MAISDQMIKLLSGRYERYLNATIGGENPRFTLPGYLQRTHPSLTPTDIGLAIEMVEQGRLNAQRLNSSAGTGRIIDIQKPLNPYVFPEANKQGKPSYTVEVDFRDNKLGKSSTWQITFESPVALSYEDIKSIGMDMFFDRYNDSPIAGGAADDVENRTVNVAVNFVALV